MLVLKIIWWIGAFVIFEAMIGYPHADESGCNHMQLILNNLQGKTNTPRIGQYEEGIYMMKYNEIYISKFLEQVL